nr:hypothetical protein CFP56_25801 [Quercus suber]
MVLCGLSGNGSVKGSGSGSGSCEVVAGGLSLRRLGDMSNAALLNWGLLRTPGLFGGGQVEVFCWSSWSDVAQFSEVGVGHAMHEVRKGMK